MLDLKSLEPELKLDYPILKHYGVKTALLYSYLKYYLKMNPVEQTPFLESPYYLLTIKRSKITKDTGLTEGEQIDAELFLNGALLIDGMKSEYDKVTLNFYPQNEEDVRRWCYEKMGVWKF